MKIKIENTPKHLELIKAMGDKNSVVANQAREAFAAFTGKMIQEILNMEGMAPLIYSDWEFNEDDNPMFPLEEFYGAPVNHIPVWSQQTAGGLGSSLVAGSREMPLSTYHLDSAVNFLEKTVRRGRLPYVSLGLNRMAQELLRKQERNAWIIVLKALAEASTNSLTHTIAATNESILQVDDFNRALTRAKRINTAWDGSSTPDQMYSKGATDWFLSPEMMEQIRGFAYQPMNTRGVPDSNESTAVALPDNVREKFFGASGVPEIYGITLHEMLEFGVGQRYNALFGSYATGNIAPGNDAFVASTDEIIVGVDVTRDALIRPIEVNGDGVSVSAQVDDQWSKRSGKLGFFVGLEEGRIVVDSRVLSGLVV